MEQVTHCPSCGAEHTEPRADGLCRRCLMQAAFSPSNSFEQAPSIDLGSGEDLDLANEAIGSYRLIQKLGEGGMGVVHLAEKAGPVRLDVALKLVKWGMDTREVLARFETERQALALMDHPNIARVLDAGATERGRPYFVMEYVKGVPITEYCDTQRLVTRERLELFIEVCEGVQHAHQKGVIHRDLKPSNVLVEVQGDRPVPKIIDFGVAKATARRLTEQTVYTELGQVLGTPEYMSPEQAEITALDIDTRTDVYSLGVLLYELLVGVRPFDFRTEGTTSYDEIRRRIREEEPPRPSARLSTLEGTTSTDLASRRRTDLGALRRQLRGDLDWITLKALEKDRTRRYGSAAELAEDIRRHLRHEPVVAGPPSVTYRARKFARRHRVGIAFAAVVLAFLVGLAVRERIQSTRIGTERDTANTVSDFLVGLFEMSDPSEARGKELTAREVLDRGAERIEVELADQPLVQARMKATIGGVYGGLGFHEQATPLHSRALEIRRNILGDDHPDTLRSITDMGLNLIKRGKLDEAEPYTREALDRSRRVLGGDDEQLLAAINNMGLLLEKQGKLDEAEPYLRESLEHTRRVFGDDHDNTLTVMNNLGLLLKTRGEFEEAERFYREALEGRRRVLGDDHPLTLSSVQNLAALLREQGKLEEAEPHNREAVEIARRVLGEDHEQTLRAINDLGLLLQNRGKLEEAEPYLREVLEIARRVFGDDHGNTLTVMNNLGVLLKTRGEYDEAERYYREALEGRRRVLGEEHPLTVSSIQNMAQLLKAQDKLEEAEPYIREALEISRRVLGDDHQRTLVAMNQMGHLLQKLGRFEEAEPYFLKALEGVRSALGEDHPNTLHMLNNMGLFLVAQGKLEEAEPYYRQALQDRRRVLGDSHYDTLEVIYNLGVLFHKQGKLEEAESYYREALDGRRRVLGDDHPNTQKTVAGLAELYEAWGKPAKASELRAALPDNPENE